MTTAEAMIPVAETFAGGHVLRLDFECLRSIPEGINEVRVWSSELLGREQVGKRVDISCLDADVLPEAATLMSIRHRNVVPINTAARVDGYPKPMRVVEIITPYYPRGSITDALLRGERFSCSEAVAITQAALRGLTELHEVHGIIHRDVKSGNVLLSDDGSMARVADLGLAARMDEQGRVAAALNPTLYTPPEHAGSGVLTRESDIYPVGLMLQELIAGAFPYDQYLTTFVVERLARQKCPIRTADLALPVWVPRDLRRIIRKAENRDPTRRYRTAAEMDAALARATIADWRVVNEAQWEAPRSHHPGEAVRIDARVMRNGKTRLSLLRYRTSWRRAADDQDVDGIDSAAGRAVFEKATAIAADR